MINLQRSTYCRSTAAEFNLPDKRLVDLIGDIQEGFPSYGYRLVTRELEPRARRQS